MEKAKIFISSTDTGMTLAKTLRDELTTDFSEAKVWQEWQEDEAALTLSQMLDSAARDYDFAVIILTRQPKEEPEVQANCFYEAGLFMSALGRDRCFLVSSIKRSELPDDLRDSNCFTLTEPSDLQDEQDCATVIKTPATKILTIVQEKKARRYQTCFDKFSEEMIFQKETTEGGELSPIGSVLVSATTPSEAENFAHAVRVRDNIDAGVKYIYFFQADVHGAGRICQLLQNILLANLIPVQDRKKFDFDAYITEKKDDILNGLWDICFRGKLRIFFLQTKPSVQFVVHNASHPDDATAYFKYQDHYILWDVGDKAHNIWQSQQNCCAPIHPHAIFLNTTCFNFINQPIREELDKELKTHFSTISQEVMSLCYRGSILKFIDGKSRIFPGDQLKGETSEASGTVAWILEDKESSYASGTATGKLILLDQPRDKTFFDENLILQGKIVARAKANP